MFFSVSILYRDNSKWGWFIWRIRYQLIALVANPHKPTSSSSPWTRTRNTGVIRHVPLQDLSWIEFQLNLSNTQRVRQDFSSHLLMWIKWESAFMCDTTPHRTDPGVLPSQTLFESRHSEFLSRRTRSETILSSAFVRLMEFFISSGWHICIEQYLDLPMGVHDELCVTRRCR